MEITVMSFLVGRKGSWVLDRIINWLPGARLPVKGDILVFEKEGFSEHTVESVEFCLTPNTFRVVVQVEDIVTDSKEADDLTEWAVENLPGWKVT